MMLHFLMMLLMMLNQNKNQNYVIIASFKSEPTCKLINRIPGLRLLISSLPGSASRMLLNRSASLAMWEWQLKEKHSLLITSS